ncbi:MAG: hypothetical protein ACMUJM_11290 [bacterium]
MMNKRGQVFLIGPCPHSLYTRHYMSILKLLFLSIITLLYSCPLQIVCAEDLPQLYEKAFLLETQEGQSDSAIEIYKNIICAKISDKNRGIIINSLRRMLTIYEETDNLIVLGKKVGPYNFDMNKNLVIKILGKPDKIFYGKNSYTLHNMPSRCNLYYGNIYFLITNDVVKRITVLDPKYRFDNGVRVGISEDKVKEAFGNNYTLNEGQNIDFLIYKKLDLRFKIDKSTRTVMEIYIRKN